MVAQYGANVGVSAYKPYLCQLEPVDGIMLAQILVVGVRIFSSLQNKAQFILPRISHPRIDFRFRSFRRAACLATRRHPIFIHRKVRPVRDESRRTHKRRPIATIPSKEFEGIALDRNGL